MDDMKHEFTTIKVWAETRKTLRLAAALTDESFVEIAHRLASKELMRLQRLTGLKWFDSETVVIEVEITRSMYDYIQEQMKLGGSSVSEVALEALKQTFTRWKEDDLDNDRK